MGRGYVFEEKKFVFTPVPPDRGEPGRVYVKRAVAANLTSYRASTARLSGTTADWVIESDMGGYHGDLGPRVPNLSVMPMGMEVNVTQGVKRLFQGPVEREQDVESHWKWSFWAIDRLTSGLGR